MITDRSRPVARLEPVASTQSDGPDLEILKTDPPHPRRGADVLAALLEDLPT